MRLFFGIALPTSIREATAQRVLPLRSLAPTVRWEAIPNLHITLRFVGEVSTETVERVRWAGAAAVRGLGLPPITLAGGGAFERDGRPSFVWIGVRSTLEPVAEAIDAQLRAHGFPADRLPFRPHMTIGRVGDGDATPALGPVRAFGEIGTFTPTHIALFSTERGRYHVIQTFAR